jgi:hypothetical protein
MKEGKAARDKVSWARGLGAVSQDGCADPNPVSCSEGGSVPRTAVLR